MNTKRIYAGCIIILFVILLTACFSIALGDASIPVAKDSNAMKSMYMKKMVELDRQITTAATQTIIPSLTKKENVDFVLTPALLMQEIMSDEVIITYPTE
jgi:hypothetical protein